MRPLASTPSNICKERVFSQVATFLPFLLVFQSFLPLLAHSLRIPWACQSAALPAAFSSRRASGRGAGGRTTARADPIIPSLAPGVITVETKAAHPVAHAPAAGLNPTRSALRVITGDNNAAYPKAIAQLTAAGILPAAVERPSWSTPSRIWSSKTIVRIKRLVKPAMGFFSMETAGRTLQGDEVMNRIGKGQSHGVAKGTSPGRSPSSPICVQWWPKLSKTPSSTPIAFGDEFLQHNRKDCGQTSGGKSERECQALGCTATRTATPTTSSETARSAVNNGSNKQAPGARQ